MALAGSRRHKATRSTIPSIMVGKVMDQELIAKIGRPQPGEKRIFSIGRNTHFVKRGQDTIMRYTADSGESIEHALRNIEELSEGDDLFDSSGEDWMDDYLPLLMAIENAIDNEHILDPGLKDKTVIAILQRLTGKPDMRLPGRLTPAIQNNMRLILSTTAYSRKQVIGCLKKVLRSAKRHHAVDGPTGYLDFIHGRV